MTFGSESTTHQGTWHSSGLLWIPGMQQLLGYLFTREGARAGRGAWGWRLEALPRRRPQGSLPVLLPLNLV